MEFLREEIFFSRQTVRLLYPQWVVTTMVAPEGTILESSASYLMRLNFLLTGRLLPPATGGG